jgi:4,4'-diaponeurosporenoate glycosyltransferase
MGMGWALALAVLWLAGFLVLWRVPRCRAASPAARRSVSIIIPARNEAHNLPGLLASLADQDPPPGEVVVVDDHSADGTARVAQQSGARVVRSADLPPGWLGKPWACWQGARQSRGAILVFLDADVRLERGGLERLLGEQQRRGGLVSVWPYHRMRRAHERLSAFFLLIVLAGMRAFTVLGGRLKPLGAFGPCLAVKRADYFAVGGHEAARGAVLDDVAIGRHFLASGIPVHCLRGSGTASFRMYPLGPLDIVEGFGKNLGLGFRAAGLTALVPTCLWIAGFFLAGGGLLLALALPGHPGLALWAAGYLLYAAALAWQLARLGNYGPFTALLFPVPLLFFAVVFLLSLARTFLCRAVRWKGRTISLGDGP